MGTIIVGAVVLAAVILAVRSICKNKKNSGCGCGCSGCGGAQKSGKDCCKE